MFRYKRTTVSQGGKTGIIGIFIIITKIMVPMIEFERWGKVPHRGRPVTKDR